MLRLLIVDDGIAAVADLTAADRTGDGELDILGQQMIIPAAFLAENISRNQKTGAGNRTVDAQTVLGRFRKRDSRRNHSA